MRVIPNDWWLRVDGIGDSESFLAAYDPRAYDPIAVAVDVVALTIRDAQLQVLLVRRGEQPQAGSWALPGGFVRPRTGPDGERTEEDLAQTAARELAEEAGPQLRATHLEQLGSYGAPGRDPRMRVVSVAYLAFAPEMPEATPGTDAADAQWVPVSALGLSPAGGPVTQRPVTQRSGTTRPLAFDHAQILADGVERARAKLEYTPLAAAFCPAEFTIAELRGVYEAVWGTDLDPRNFHRKVTTTDGFVRSTGRRRAQAVGRPAELFQQGDADVLYPPVLRPR